MKGRASATCRWSTPRAPWTSISWATSARRPERERFAIILNELGAGLAGRGSDLNAVIRRANPALREVNAVLGILAGENKVLANLAEEGDRALAPWAKVRGQVADFIVQANTVNTATARHRGALAQNLALFPVFLRQLGPAMQRLGEFGEQATPALTNLGLAAPGINRDLPEPRAVLHDLDQVLRKPRQELEDHGPRAGCRAALLQALQDARRGGQAVR